MFFLWIIIIGLAFGLLTWAVPLDAAEDAPLTLALGNSHTCALIDGGVSCRGWGLALGTGNDTDRAAPAGVSGLSSGVQALAAGRGHTCALLETGGVMCWGQNGAGQLGDGTTTRSAQPVPVQGLPSGVTDIATGSFHSCAVIGDAARCWGRDAEEQLGIGNSTRGSVELSKLWDTAYTDISVGARHVCAVAAGGAAQCWGNNHRGELGIGEPVGLEVTRSSPQPVVGLASGVSRIAAGLDFTCAIVDGAAKCWGRNQYGQLGNGMGANSARPVQVAGLTGDVTALSASTTQVCVVQAGEVLCWGSGFSATPQAVSGAPGGYRWVTTGGATCWLSDGQTLCSGRDQEGRLGAGRVDVRTTPVPVLGLGPGLDLYVHYDSAQPGSVLNVIGAPVADTFTLSDSALLRGPEGAAPLIAALAGAPAAQTAAIGTGGGVLTTTLDGAVYTFPAGAFTAPVTVTHAARRPWQLPATGALVAVGPAFDVTAVYTSTGQPAQIASGQVFTVTVPYGDAWVAVPETLGLWWWDTGANVWSQAGIVSAVDVAQQQVTAQVAHLSLFAVLGETQRIYLPLVVSRHD